MPNSIVSIIAIAFGIIFIYVAVDFFSKTANEFFNKWAKKLLWAWLPFYAFYFLVKKLFGEKDKQ